MNSGGAPQIVSVSEMREHAFAWTVARSENAGGQAVAGGNTGKEQVGEQAMPKDTASFVWSSPSLIFLPSVSQSRRQRVKVSVVSHRLRSSLHPQSAVHLNLDGRSPRCLLLEPAANVLLDASYRTRFPTSLRFADDTNTAGRIDA